MNTKSVERDFFFNKTAISGLKNINIAWFYVIHNFDFICEQGGSLEFPTEPQRTCSTNFILDSSLKKWQYKSQEVIKEFDLKILEQNLSGKKIIQNEQNNINRNF